MNIKWTIKSVEDDSEYPIVSQYAANHNLPIEFFLSDEKPDFFPYRELSNIEISVSAIWDSIINGEPILVFGDYDVDGITSTYVMYTFLKLFTDDVYWFLPSRKDGYGISESSLRKAESEYSFQTLITVDNGIVATEAVNYANSRGFTTIITDHHSPDENRIPDTPYIVNPHLTDIENPDLSGCVVSAKTMMMFLEYGQRHHKDRVPKGYKTVNPEQKILDMYIDIMALSTIADVMSLRVPENRWIVKRGLEKINRAEAHEGILSLLTDKAYPTQIGDVTYRDIAFGVAPPFNAVGRIEHPKYGMYLLLGKNIGEIKNWVAYLLKTNQSRKDMQNTYTSHEPQHISDIVMMITHAPHGLVGLIASSLVMQYQKPAIVFSRQSEIDINSGTNILKGSARSMSGIDIGSAIRYADDLLIKHGGHEMAAGLSIAEANFDSFADVISQRIKSVTPEHTYRYGIPLNMPDFDDNVYESVRLLEPCGADLPRPHFMAFGMRLTRIAYLGSSERHVIVTVSKGTDVYTLKGWGLGYCVNHFNAGDLVDVAYTIDASQNDTPILETMRKSDVVYVKNGGLTSSVVDTDTLSPVKHKIKTLPLHTKRENKKQSPFEKISLRKRNKDLKYDKKTNTRQ